MTTPDHLRGPEWHGWETVFAEQPIEWEKDEEYDYEECLIGGRMVAWIVPRPSYCDRGHWLMHCDLPGLDGSDGFPRYYMNKETAIKETEAFLRWRLWKIRCAT